MKKILGWNLNTSRYKIIGVIFGWHDSYLSLKVFTSRIFDENEVNRAARRQESSRTNVNNCWIRDGQLTRIEKQTRLRFTLMLYLFYISDDSFPFSVRLWRKTKRPLKRHRRLLLYPSRIGIYGNRANYFLNRVKLKSLTLKFASAMQSKFVLRWSDFSTSKTGMFTNFPVAKRFRKHQLMHARRGTIQSADYLLYTVKQKTWPRSANYPPADLLMRNETKSVNCARLSQRRNWANPEVLEVVEVLKVLEGCATCLTKSRPNHSDLGFNKALRNTITDKTAANRASPSPNNPHPGKVVAILIPPSEWNIKFSLIHLQPF